MHVFFEDDGALRKRLAVPSDRRMWDLFRAIDNVPDPAEVVRLAGLHEVNFLPPP